MYKYIDCIDAGTEFCPCNLAETGECILCSQIQGENFCQCTNWKGVCIYGELFWNGGKAKERRRNYVCRIKEKELLEDNLILLKIAVSNKLARDLTGIGSFVFIKRQEDEDYFFMPISIVESNTKENVITLIVEVRGIKSKKIKDLNIEDYIIVRGPFWNGVQGRKNIYKSKNGKSIVISKGIGMAPMIPVIKKLLLNENEVYVIADKTPFKNLFFQKFIDLNKINLIETNIFKNGELTLEFKKNLTNLMDDKLNLIHVACQDIIVYKTIKFTEDKVPMSCCNNIKMCCGDGVCGSCSVRFKGHTVRRLCKLQTEPKYLFEGRRFI